MTDPFTLDEARAAGLTRAQLLGRRWRRLGPAIYASSAVASEPLVRLKAASRRLPADAVFSGQTAAWLHGLDTRFGAIEATLSPPTRTAHLAGIAIRRRRLKPDEIVLRKGFRVTSAARTVIDLASSLDLVETVVILDAALHKRLIRLSDIKPRAGARGVRTLRRAIELAEPATESPMETRLRLALVLGGLPRPCVQTPLGVARADLYYPDQRLVIEYDGATHRDSITADNRRQNRLVEAGYLILRFSAADVLGDPTAVIELVRKALRA